MQVRTTNQYMLRCDRISLMEDNLDGKWNVQRIIREAIKARSDLIPALTPAEFVAVRKCDIVLQTV